MARLAGRTTSGSLYALTGGNPFYVTEVVAAGSPGDGAVPLTVADAVMARVHGLPAPTRSALEQLAVVPSQVELPLARPVLLAGVRTAAVYNVGTATVGAALGAGGLGRPIIDGLSQQNTALVLAGALLAALLALSLDGLLGLLIPARRENA